MAITLSIKIIFWALAGGCIIFSLYSFYLLNSNSKIKTKLPQPYRGIYNKAMRIPVLNLEVEKYRNDLILIKGSTYYGELHTSIYCGLIPTLMVLVILLVSNYVDSWYFAVLIGLFGTLIPYLYFVNNISKKAYFLRKMNIRYYQAAERFYSNGTQTAETFSQLKITSIGALRNVYTNFINNYYQDCGKAYDEFVMTINDKYAKSFIKAVIACDEDGIDPCPEIGSIVLTASNHYRLLESSMSVLSGVRRLALIILGACILLGVMSGNLSATLGVKPSADWLTYSGIVMSLAVILVSQLFEKN